MKINEQEVVHVSRLSRLNLSDQEISTYAGQMEKILEYVDKLSRLDLEGIEPTSSNLQAENVMRSDEKKQDCDPETVLKNAPDRKNNFFSVPRVID